MDEYHSIETAEVAVNSINGDQKYPQPQAQLLLETTKIIFVSVETTWPYPASAIVQKW